MYHLQIVLTFNVIFPEFLSLDRTLVNRGGSARNIFGVKERSFYFYHPQYLRSAYRENSAKQVPIPPIQPEQP